MLSQSRHSRSLIWTIAVNRCVPSHICADSPSLDCRVHDFAPLLRTTESLSY